MREKDDSARGKILEAAKAEFLERGFAEASMRTIAERAGFTTGMLYSALRTRAKFSANWWRGRQMNCTIIS